MSIGETNIQQMSQDGIAIAHLSKRYKQLKAVDDLSFFVPQGSIFGLLGPNGAGKTTTIRMISGLMKPDAGSIHYFGKPLNQRTLPLLGLCPQELAIWENLTVWEQLGYVASIYNVDASTAKLRAESLLTALHMGEHRRKLGSALSGGMKRRLNIMLALMHDPQVLIFDEPQAGLDPQSRLLVRNFISGLRGHKTVIVTTHDMEEAEKLLDEVAIVDGGRILDSGTPQALKTRHMKASILRMTWQDDFGRPEEVFGLGEEDIQRVGDRLDIVAGSNAAAAKLYQSLQQQVQERGLPIFDLELRQPTLEDLFIHLTGRSLRE